MDGPEERAAATRLGDALASMRRAPGDAATAEARRFATALRRLLSATAWRRLPAETLRRLADQAEAMIALTDPVEEPRTDHRHLRDAVRRGERIDFLEWSPVTGRANPLAPPLHVHIDEDRALVVAEVTFGQAYQGPPGCVHGGYIATVFDEALAMAESLTEQLAVTGTLEVRYRQPTPLHQRLRVEAWLVERSGRRIATAGRIVAPDGTVTAEADGVFVVVDPGRFGHVPSKLDP